MAFLHKAFNRQFLQKVGGDTKRFLSKVSQTADTASRKVTGTVGVLDKIDRTGILGGAARALGGGLKGVSEGAQAGRQLYTGNVTGALQTAKQAGQTLGSATTQGIETAAKIGAFL